MDAVYSDGVISENISLAENIFRLSIKGSYKGNPGQFYMLRGWDKEPFLSRPISIHNISEEKLTFLYEVKGEGTRIFSKLRRGDSIQLLGPLGNGFDIENIRGKIAIVTGGIGIAPMYFTSRMLKNCVIDVYTGFRKDVYLIDDLKKYVENIYISTDKGNKGHKGYIIDIFNPKEYDIVLSCGPKLMMNKVVESCKSHNVKLYISMESNMACGIGACLGCTCKTVDGNKRTCVEGPVFPGEDVRLNA